ncbi:MAG: TetR/AcrR family transcriptional regulator [Clostridia bacterium]|nr:TetR/AcrR family transcriptional regulator [Clostridia bacterium]
MPTIEEKKNIKRTKIIDAASKLFMDKSFALTAVDDVVRMAGVAKGTFYLYFKDKYDLLNQIVTYKGAEVLRGGVEELKKTDAQGELTLTGKVLFLADYIADYLAQHKDLTALVNKNLTYCFRHFTSGENAEFSEIADMFISQFVSEGYSESEAKMTLYIITDLIGGVCCDAVLGTGPFTLEEIKPIMKKAISDILEAKHDD